MRIKQGDRVGAVESATDDTVNFFGWGFYEGDEVPDEQAAGFLAEAAREHGNTNPKILLDSGKVVWGCECWWGSEERVQKMIGDREVVEVDIDEARARAKGEDEG